MFGCKCVSVTAMISNSSVKLLRKSNLFRALQIFMLHTETGGGILIYFKDYISVIRKNELENHIDESIWVEIQGTGTRFLLCSTYRPEWTDADYWTRLNHAIGMGYQINQNIILSGDLNSALFTSHIL
jgi:hypothetical protein